MATGLCVVIAGVALAFGPVAKPDVYEVTFAGRHLSIPVNYFQGAPRHDDVNGRLGIYLQYLWPSMEGRTEENRSAFNDPYMPVNGVLMHDAPQRTDEETIAILWKVYAYGHQPANDDPRVGEFYFKDDVPDRNGLPLDIYYQTAADGAVSEFIVCDMIGETGRPLPNPGCSYFYVDDGVDYLTDFRLHLLPEASAMKTAWLAKMREFEGK